MRRELKCHRHAWDERKISSRSYVSVFLFVILLFVSLSLHPFHPRVHSRTCVFTQGCRPCYNPGDKLWEAGLSKLPQTQPSPRPWALLTTWSLVESRGVSWSLVPTSCTQSEAKSSNGICCYIQIERCSRRTPSSHLNAKRTGRW